MVLMMRRTRLVMWSILLSLVLSSFPSSVLSSIAEDETEPFVEESILWAGLDDPDAILLKEIEWAQKSMERYHQKHGEYPENDDSTTKHQTTDIYSMKWVEDSMESLKEQEIGYITRDSRWKNRSARFLRGAVGLG